MSYEKEIDHFVTEDEEVIGLKDSYAREESHKNGEKISKIPLMAIPFSNVKLVLKAFLEVDSDTVAKASCIGITKDLDGNPLSMRACLIVSDYASSVSYGRMQIGSDQIHQGVYVSTPTKNVCALVSISPNGLLYTRQQSSFSLQAYDPEGLLGGTNASWEFAHHDRPFSSITGVGFVSVKSMTFIKIYEIVHDDTYKEDL